MSKMHIFSGTANQRLAKSVCDVMGIECGKIEVKRFADGEIFVEIGENVRGQECFVIQPTCKPTNDNLMELLITVDALKRASAGSITAVIPYFGYARQDRKTKPRSPITARLTADLLTAAGVQRVVTIDLHSPAIQGFFSVPVDNLYAKPVFVSYVKLHYDTDKLIIVSPDAGGVARARSYAEALHVPMAIVDKRRSAPNVSEVMHVIGDVKGKHALLVDDMIDTAGTICHAAQALVDDGALTVAAACTHGVLSGPALKRLAESPIAELLITDTIPNLGSYSRIKQLTLAPLIGQALMRIHDGESVSSLFD